MSSTLKITSIGTPLGDMVTVGDDRHLYILQFSDSKSLERDLALVRRTLGAQPLSGEAATTRSIARELALYFSGELQAFQTPFRLLGTSFQQRAWGALSDVPYGQTRTYAQQASALGHPTAFRAVGNANGANRLTILIPCHRILQCGGKWGGYGAGLPRKQWLIRHERDCRAQAPLF